MIDLWKELNGRSVGAFRLQVERYAEGDRPKVIVLVNDPDPEPDCVLTVNLPDHDLGPTEFFVKIELYELTPIFAMLVRDQIAVPTGRTVSAGYVDNYAEVWRLVDPAELNDHLSEKLETALRVLEGRKLKPVIAYRWCTHPTEGVLVQRVLFPDDPERWEQGWQRVTDLVDISDDRALTALSVAQRGFKADDFEWRALGEVACPDMETGVTGTYDQAAGELQENGISVQFGGACPVQGDGSVDGQVLYYRSRGSGWSVEIGEGGPDEFYYGESRYVWPDGGWVRADVSRAKIRLAVAKWREHRRLPKCPRCGH